MKLKASFKVTKNDFARIGAGARRKAGQLVRKTAADVEAGTKVRSRVGETGNMRAGWQQEPDGEYAVIVYNNVEYAIHHEYGTYKMTAQPMLHPSMDEERRPFDAGMARLLDG
jgi:hypothetical protein